MSFFQAAFVSKFLGGSLLSPKHIKSPKSETLKSKVLNGSDQLDDIKPVLSEQSQSLNGNTCQIYETKSNAAPLSSQEKDKTFRSCSLSRGSLSPLPPKVVNSCKVETFSNKPMSSSCSKKTVHSDHILSETSNYEDESSNSSSSEDAKFSSIQTSKSETPPTFKYVPQSLEGLIEEGSEYTAVTEPGSFKLSDLKPDSEMFIIRMPKGMIDSLALVNRELSIGGKKSHKLTIGTTNFEIKTYESSTVGTMPVLFLPEENGTLHHVQPKIKGHVFIRKIPSISQTLEEIDIDSLRPVIHKPAADLKQRNFFDIKDVQELKDRNHATYSTFKKKKKKKKDRKMVRAEIVKEVENHLFTTPVKKKKEKKRVPNVEKINFEEKETKDFLDNLLVEKSGLDISSPTRKKIKDKDIKEIMKGKSIKNESFGKLPITPDWDENNLINETLSSKKNKEKRRSKVLDSLDIDDELINSAVNGSFNFSSPTKNNKKDNLKRGFDSKLIKHENLDKFLVTVIKKEENLIFKNLSSKKKRKNRTLSDLDVTDFNSNSDFSLELFDNHKEKKHKLKKSM